MAYKKWMEPTMNRRKTLTPSEWVTQSIQDSKNDFMDAHFDIFQDYRSQRGLSLLTYACHVLIEARASAELLANEQKYFKPFIYLPFGYNLACVPWDSSNWIQLGEKNGQAIYEPPSLYLLAKRELLLASLDLEEYRFPLQFPSDFLLDEKNKIAALYRCFRDQQAIENDWEFAMGIYLFYKGDF